MYNNGSKSSLNIFINPTYLSIAPNIGISLLAINAPSLYKQVAINSSISDKCLDVNIFLIKYSKLYKSIDEYNAIIAVFIGPSLYLAKVL